MADRPTPPSGGFDGDGEQGTMPELRESSDVVDAEGGPRAGRSASLSGATAIMASGTLVSRVLGFVRNALLVGAIGLNAFGANAYDAANRIPNALYAVLAAGVLNAVLVPQIVRAFRRPDGKRTVDRILTLGLAMSLGVTVLFTLAAPLVVRFYSSPSWSDDQRALATAFAFLVIPQLFFYAAYTILGQVLNAREQFGPYMWAPVLNNVVAIAGILVYLRLYGDFAEGTDNAAGWTADRILWLALPATIAMAAQAAVLIWPMMRGGYHWRFQWRGPKGELSVVRTVAGWALAGVIIEQIGMALSVFVSSAANPEGKFPGVAGNAAYFNALMIYLVPHSLVTVSILTALGTTIAKHYSVGDVDGMRRVVARGLRLIGAFTMFASAALIVMAPMLVRTLLPKAKTVDVESVAPVLVALALGLVPLGAMVLVKRVYFELEDAKGIFLIHIPMTIAWAGIAFLGMATLDRRWWTVCVALGLTLSNVVGLALRGNGLRKRLGGLGGQALLRVHVQALIAALAAAAVGVALRVTVIPDVEQASSNPILIGGFSCLVMGTAMAITYGALLKLMHVSEINSLIETVTRKLRRTVR